MDASSLLQDYSIHRSGTSYQALLVGQYGSEKYPDEKQQQESLKELKCLADTARVTNAYHLLCYISEPSSRYFLTKGFLEQVREKITEKTLNLLIIDAELRPRQIRNLEEELKLRVLGRVELILDIFAMRAKTKTSFLQVELAQLNYILPRLKGLGGILSRLGGGIGTKGPGETMLETDRRHIRRRIQKIKDELKGVSKHRSNLRKNRVAHTFALVGYTNAGKTTLLNQLSSSHKKLFAEDRLFATLDPFSRKVYLGEFNYRPVYAVLTDTVGFIRNLPAALVAAFHSTLEEIRYTDTIIIVLDASSNNLGNEKNVVEKELENLGIRDKEVLFFLNKCDLLLPGGTETKNGSCPFQPSSSSVELTKKINLRPNNTIYGYSLSKVGVSRLREKMFTIIKNQRL